MLLLQLLQKPSTLEIFICFDYLESNIEFWLRSKRFKRNLKLNKTNARYLCIFTVLNFQTILNCSKMRLYHMTDSI